MLYNFDEEIKIPQSVIDRKEREKALDTLEKGVGNAVNKIEEPLSKIAKNLAVESSKNIDFKKSINDSILKMAEKIELIKEVNKESDKVAQNNLEIQKYIYSSLEHQAKEIKKYNESKKIVEISNIEDINIPEIPSDIKVEFKKKQEVFGKVDTGLVIPDVQVVRFEKEIKPPVINITENKIEFPKLQKVELKNKIKPPIINITEKKISFPKLQKVEFKTIPTVKIQNPQKMVKISNLSDIKLELPEQLNINNLPIAKGNKPSVKLADPGVYIPIRLTDGNKFIDNIGGTNTNSVVMGGSSSLPQQWINTSGVIGTSSTLILESNEMRVTSVITNDSDSVIYLSFGDEAVLHTGIRLNQFGGSYEIGKTNHFKGNIFGISDTPDNIVCVLEVSKKV